MYSSVKKVEGVSEVLSAMRSMIVTGPRPFYSLNETKTILGMSRTQIYELDKQGLLSRRCVGRKVYYTWESIEDLVMVKGRDAANSLRIDREAA